MVLFIRNREELEHELITLHAEGSSIRSLSRRFHLSRNTVRRILRQHHAKRSSGHDRLAHPKQGPRRASKVDPFVQTLKELINRFPNITGQRAYEELVDAGYTGGITMLRERLSQLRPHPSKKPVVRFETEPGRQGQMDWSPYTIPFVRTGKTKVLCFSYILGYSRRHFIDFVLHRDFYTLIRRHQDTFNYFQGVPRECLYDNEKTVVLRWEAGKPVFNPAFIAFITHYTCRPIACLRGRKETKGKVEAPFQYVEHNLLNARAFQDLEDLKATARWWLGNRSDLHIHDTTGRAPGELFIEREQTALQPLPLHPYDASEVGLRVCRVDGLLEFETNLYSVPYEYIADILALKATETEVLIYSPELSVIACHERLPRGAGKTVERPEHRGSKRVRYGLESIKEAFTRLGEAAEPFLNGLKAQCPRNGGFQARAILHLKETYHCTDINSALAHAIRYQAYDSKAIERILKAKAKPRSLESVRNERAGEGLQNTLPPITQRPLDEYSALLKIEEDRNGERSETAGGNGHKYQETPEDTQP